MHTIYKNPLVWNDSIWLFLYCSGFAYPKEPNKNDKKYFKVLMDCLYYVLPCDMCKVYFQEFIKKNPIQSKLEKQSLLLNYIIRLRNYIMKYYDKNNIITLKEVKNDLQSKCLNQTTPMTLKNPRLWGTATWFFLHCASFNYPKNPTQDDKKYYKLFLIALQHTLPCKLCRKHLKEYMKTHCIDEHLDKKISYIKYIINLHNHVNFKFNDKSKISYKKAKELILENCFYQYEKKQVY